MARQRAQEIVDAYDRIEDAEDDISTERLLAMTSDECGCDDADVCEALQIING